MQYDVVFRNVLVVDGTGESTYSADVAIKEGRILEVGDLANADAITLIDGNGLALSPGFIDVHTHDDTNVIRYPDCLVR